MKHVKIYDDFLYLTKSYPIIITPNRYELLLRIDLSIFPFTVTNRGSKTICFLLLAVQKRTKEHTCKLLFERTEEFLRINRSASQNQMCLTKQSMYKAFIKQVKKSPKLSLSNLQEKNAIMQICM